MLNQFSRTQLLLGEDGMERLFKARAAVFGSGLCAASAAEALARSGVGAIDVFGGNKALAERLISINPDLKLDIFDLAVCGLTEYDYIIDTAGDIDKTIKFAAAGVQIISVVDITGRSDITAITVGDINKIKSPYSERLGYELRKHGVKKLKCVYSAEKPDNNENTSHVLMAAGLIAAGEAVKALAEV